MLNASNMLPIRLQLTVEIRYSDSIQTWVEIQTSKCQYMYSESLKDNKGLSQCYFGNISVLD